MNLYNKVKTFLSERKERKNRTRDNEQQMQLLKQVAVLHETFNKFKEAGLIYVDVKHKNVTISNVLASFYIDNEEDWQNFLHNVHGWVVYQYSISEYVRLFHKAKADAEARAYENNHAISQAERMQVKMQAAETFDIDQQRERTVIPDLQFIVLGASDGKPIIVARLINGVYDTSSVPEELR